MQGQILLLFSQSKSINYYFWCLIIFIAVLHFKQQIAFCLQKYPAVQPHYFFQSVYLYKSTQTTGGDQTTEFDTTFSFTLRYVTQSFLVFSISISKKGTACLPQNQNLKKNLLLPFLSQKSQLFLALKQRRHPLYCCDAVYHTSFTFSLQ